MKIIKIVTFVQIISWAFFVFTDYISENFSNEILLNLYCFLYPVAIPVAYIVFREKIHYSSIPNWVNTLTVMFVWVIENILFCWLIGTYLIIPQSTALLNGIEYVFFPFFNIVAFLFIVAVWNLILYIFRKLN